MTPNNEIYEDMIRVAKERNIPVTMLPRDTFQAEKRWKWDIKAEAMRPWRKMQAAAFDHQQTAQAAQPRAVTVAHATEMPPSSDIEELLQRRSREYRRKADHSAARQSYRIKVDTDKPFGLLHFGDPHLDDPGTDIDILREHARLVAENPWLMAGSIGDNTNNWVGRLTRLYANQSVTAKEAVVLLEWFIEAVGRENWLYLIAGNHDLWSGAQDPVAWLRKRTNAPYEVDLHLILEFSNGREVEISLRHHFRGNSIYHPTHGAARALRFGGIRADILVSGHIHRTGYLILSDPNPQTKENPRLHHCLQIGSYKTHDSYAEEVGFEHNNWSPCAVTVINPQAASYRDLVQVFWDAHTADRYLRTVNGGG